MKNGLPESVIIAAHVPAAPLNQFVELMWFHEGLNAGHPLERVLPDGSMELIVNLRDEPRHVFEPVVHRPRQSFRRSWLSGPHSKYIVIDTAPNASMIGAHFRPGGARAVFDLPLGELRNAVFDLESLWGDGARELRDQLLEASSPQEKFRRLEEILLRRWRRSSHHLAVRHALDRLTRQPHETTIGNVRDETGLSPRRFIELFTREVGITPKVFCRVRRFRRALLHVQRSPEPRWARVANDCGYYDQAHFIRDFKEFTGLTPGEYIADRPAYPGFVPIRAR
jgi:AraC-like DNA-binding protein